jgi:hypothetical protein
MDYQEFADLLLEALRQARFPGIHLLCPIETIDTRSMDRTYRSYLRWPETPETRMFNVTAEVSWVWDTVLSARFATTEEDMLMQIFGDFGIHEDTEPPWLRIDMSLHASISLDKSYPMPLLANWQHWVEKVSLELESFLPGDNENEGKNQAINAWHGIPEAVITFSPQGDTFLQKVSLRSCQGITLPRQWDDPDKADPYPDEQLYQFATRLQQVLEIWQERLELLLDGQEH